MLFRNRTPFPALAFEGVDQHDMAFHVVVLRQTLTWDDSGVLRFADEQRPLCECDEPQPGLGDESAHPGDLRQESDLCPYKPRCDVIVNGLAHAPVDRLGRAAPRFVTRLVIRPLEVAGGTPSSRPLIDKTLVVTGERDFVRRAWPWRMAGQVTTLLTLGLLRPSPWRLSAPRAQPVVPMRLSRAFGGERFIAPDTPEARRVPRHARLATAQRSTFPQQPAPWALDAIAANPAGRGHAPQWFLKAMRLSQLAAPQVEHPDHPVTGRVFDRARTGRLGDERAGALVAGLGVRPKSHPGRARLVGPLDAAFLRGETALPADFDFAVWNAAWPDQQVDALRGDELVELTNLCSPTAAGARSNAQGRTVLRLKLPGHVAQLLVRLRTGEVFAHAMRPDTLIVEPELRQVSLVWRAVLAKIDDVPVRALEALVLSPENAQQQRREIEAWTQRLQPAAGQAPPQVAAHG